MPKPRTSKTFHGAVCPRCSGTERYPSNKACTQCHRADAKRRGSQPSILRKKPRPESEIRVDLEAQFAAITMKWHRRLTDDRETEPLPRGKD